MGKNHKGGWGGVELYEKYFIRFKQIYLTISTCSISIIEERDITWISCAFPRKILSYFSYKDDNQNNSRLMNTSAISIRKPLARRTVSKVI